MTDASILSFSQIEAIAFSALTAAGTSEANARSLARAVAAAERDGIASHGLMYVPIYCSHVACGKVDGRAEPELSRPRPGTVRVDAKTGFAHPAIELGFPALIASAEENGIACLAIHNSYNCGALGYHVERLAEAGLVGLGFTNAPASIAPAGGTRAVFGTNPFALSVPGEAGPAITIDQSASVVAKSEVMKRARRGEAIPDGWALDQNGQPTSDPDAALKGTMAPLGGYKGVGLALLTEVMAAALTGAMLGVDASAFSGSETYGAFAALKTNAASGGVFAERIARIVDVVEEQEGARLPGSGRHAARRKADAKGVAVDPKILEAVRKLAAGSL